MPSIQNLTITDNLPLVNIRIESKVDMDRIIKQYNPLQNDSDEVIVDMTCMDDDSDEYIMGVELLSQSVMDLCIGSYVLFHP